MLEASLASAQIVCEVSKGSSVYASNSVLAVGVKSWNLTLTQSVIYVLNIVQT